MRILHAARAVMWWGVSAEKNFGSWLIELKQWNPFNDLLQPDWTLH
ncbi:TPA: hypothetical protein ACGSU0_003496 [Vibrio parahaemolyticus]|nr:hypothetical protein [Vibrio natriegens]